MKSLSGFLCKRYIQTPVFQSDRAFFLFTCEYICRNGYFNTFCSTLTFNCSVFISFWAFLPRDQMPWWFINLELTLWSGATFSLPTARPHWFKAETLHCSYKDPLGDSSLEILIVQFGAGVPSSSVCCPEGPLAYGVDCTMLSYLILALELCLKF